MAFGEPKEERQWVAVTTTATIESLEVQVPAWGKQTGGEDCGEGQGVFLII